MSEPLVVGTTAATVYPSTGKRSLGDLKRGICTYFGMQDDPEKLLQAGRMIEDLIDDLNRKKLWQFNLKQAADFTSVGGTSTYSLVTIAPDIWKIYEIRKSNDIDYKLSSMRQSIFDTMFMSQNNIVGYPYVSVNFNLYRDGTIRLFPTPDSAHTYTLRYFALIAKPSDDSDTLDMPPPFQTVPYYGAIARMAALVGHRTLAYWQAEYEKAYKQMNDMDEKTDDSEELRFIHVEEMESRAARWLNPALRPRYLDLY